MKTSTFVSLAAAAVVLAGCVVTSVCPFYTQKDLLFETAILGNWVKADKEDEIWRFEKSRNLEYRFTLIEARKKTVMEAHAFKLQGQLFLDIFSLEQDVHVVPAHYLLKVTQLTPDLEMSELNHEWLKQLLTRDPTALRHHFVSNGEKPEDRRVVLTAGTPELQEFVIKHLKTEGAWKGSFDLKRDQSGNTRLLPVPTSRLRDYLRQDSMLEGMNELVPGLITRESANTSKAVTDQPTAIESVNSGAEGPLLRLERKPNEIATGKFRLSGILIESAKADNPLHLLNPFAPWEYDSAADNIVRDPISGRVSGLKLFSIQF